MAKLALRAEGHELELLAAVEGEEEEEEGAAAEGLPQAAVSVEPTMMSQEARTLFLSGDKDSGLAAWKVRGLGWVGAWCGCAWVRGVGVCAAAGPGQREGQHEGQREGQREDRRCPAITHTPPPPHPSRATTVRSCG